MYAYIIGILTEVQNNLIVLETGGIGYSIFVSESTISKIGTIGEQIKIFTYLHVREDEMLLFGFSSMAEKQMFLNLTTVSGIGSKTAMGILSGISLQDLAMCIISEDSSALSKIKGIGKKTAERIILELKEKIEMFDSGNIDDSVVNGKETEYAINVLLSLGLQKHRIIKIIREVAQKTDTAEEIVSKVLQSLN